MSKNNTKLDNNEIVKGLTFFTKKNSTKVKPKELKNIMEKLGLANKLSLTYFVVNDLCSNKQIKRNGGITKDEFTPFLEEKMDELYTKNGINGINSLSYLFHSNQNAKKSYSTQKSKEEKDKENEKIKNEIKKYIKDKDLEENFQYYQRISEKNKNKYNIDIKTNKYSKENKNQTTNNIDKKIPYAIKNNEKKINSNEKKYIRFSVRNKYKNKNVGGFNNNYDEIK